MKVLSDLEVSNKAVFLRADLDVPLKSTNDERLTTNAEQATRLKNLKPTVDWLLEHGARRIIIAGHIGRPKQLTVDSSQLTENTDESKPQFYDPKLSTKQLLPALAKILGQKISFVPDLSSYSKPGLGWVDKPGLSGGGEVFLLENLRFWPGEEANDVGFAKQLATLADVYVNEAFGVSHRVHASVVGVPALLPHAAGLHLEKEVEVLSKLLKDPQRPFVAIVGGEKIETKVPVIESLAKVADFVLVGGEIAKELTVYGSQFTDGSKIIVATLTEDDKEISNESIHQFKEVIANAKTVVWNGPMGVFEEGSEKGTLEVANAIAESGSFSVVGGGETTEFLGKLGLLGRFSFVSSGGGAMLEFLSGKELPGIKALE